MNSEYKGCAQNTRKAYANLRPIRANREASRPSAGGEERPSDVASRQHRWRLSNGGGAFGGHATVGAGCEETHLA